MTFAAPQRALRTSRAAKHPAAAGPSPFAAPMHAHTEPAHQRTTLPPNPENIPAEHRLSGEGASAPQQAAVPALVRQALSTPGEPLDTRIRATMEQRFGRDFHHVRVHTGDSAAASASAVDAHAYGVGPHLVFNRDRYAPGTVSGRRLLIHELAHVVQDSGSHLSGNDLRIDSPDSPAERWADFAVRNLDRASSLHPGFMSAQLASMSPSAPVLRRAVSTWGGTWNTAKYEDHDTGGVKDGADIDLHFKPGPPVDATKIGLIQMVTNKKNGAVVNVSPTTAARSVPAGQPGEGANIDQLSQFDNPLYATDAPNAANAAAGKKDALYDTPANPLSGDFGFHHTDAKGVVHQKDATLKDAPRIPGSGPNSSQIFEVTALAVTGVQAGANYGSVQWGWQKDNAGAFKRLPLSKVSDTVPSGTFDAARTQWNKSKDAAGKDLIKFASASERFVQADDTPLVSDPADAAKTELAKMPTNTRVEVIDFGFNQKFNPAGAKSHWLKVTVTDGPSVGKTGWAEDIHLGRTKVKAGAANAKP